MKQITLLLVLFSVGVFGAPTENPAKQARSWECKGSSGNKVSLKYRNGKVDYLKVQGYELIRDGVKVPEESEGAYDVKVGKLKFTSVHGSESYEVTLKVSLSDYSVDNTYELLFQNPDSDDSPNLYNYSTYSTSDGDGLTHPSLRKFNCRVTNL